MRKNEAVIMQLEDEFIPTPVSAYEVAKEDGYSGSEERYTEEMALLGRDLKQKYFDEIPSLINKFTKTTEKSDYHHITDSAAYDILDMELQGKTEQTQYEGNQLLPYPYSNTTGTYGGVLVTDNGDGSLTFNGSSSEDASFYLKAPVPITLSAGTYTLEVSGLTDGLKCNLFNIYSSSIDYIGTFTLEEDTMLRMSLSISQGYIFNTTVYPMLNAGDTALSYEPYVGGIPSPNPQYPQEIINAGVLNEDTGKYEIECKVANKNLFDESKLSNGEFVEFNGVRCYKYTDNDKNFLYDGNFKENTQYSFTFRIFRDNDEMNKDKHTYIHVLYTDGSLHNIVMKPNIVNTYTSDIGKSISGISGNYNYSVNVYLDLSIMQIEEGAEVTDYTAPNHQQITLTSDRPITKWDKLVKRDGVWGWSINSIIRENIQISRNTIEDTLYTIKEEKFARFYFKYIKNDFSQVEGECTMFPFRQKPKYDGNFECGFWYGIYLYVICNKEKLGITDDDDAEARTDKFVTYMQNKTVTFIYHVDTEQLFIQLSDEEQALLNNLETYYGVTNVYNDQGCPMWLTYVQDLKIAIDNKIKQLKS